MFLIKKGLAALSLCCLSVSATYAASHLPAKSISPMVDVSLNTPWIFSGAMGFTQLDDMLNKDGQTFFTRLSAEKIFYQREENSLGFEVGVQTGLQGRLGMSDADNDNLDGTSVMTTFKPVFDMLLTYHRDFKNHSTSGYVKAGGMYRQLTFDRGTINDLSQVNPELQIGISQKISNNVSLSVGYQGIFSSGLKLETFPSLNEAKIKNIPSQSGILLSVNYIA